MCLKIAIQMDHISLIDINVDSTFIIALEAQKRGFELFHYQPHNLIMRENRLYAWGEALKVKNEIGNHFELGSSELVELSEMHVILMRQDPPFDLAYITATHLLEHLMPNTLVVNNPREVRNCPEKIFVTDFSEFTPPTLITANQEQIHLFRAEHKDIILKPLFGNGGAGVLHITSEDENLNAILEIFKAQRNEPIIAQKYLPAVRKGDKRIILIDGKFEGATNRVPKQGEARSNMHVGGQAEKSSLTSRDAQICEALGPELKKRGLLFTGIDIIGGFLTEINVTSPTGIQEVNRFDNIALEKKLWDKIETLAKNV